MTNFIVFIIKFTLLLFGMYVVYKIFSLLKQVITLAKRKKTVDELKRKFDVFSVEGEVMSFTSKRISKLDTRYDINISYNVEGRVYVMNAIIFNRGSLRVGQKVLLLCDSDDFGRAVMQNADENEALIRLIMRLVTVIVIIIVLTCIFIARTLSGMNDLVGIIEEMGDLFRF